MGRAAVDLVVHAAHTTAGHCRRALFRLVGDHHFGGDEQAGDRRRALKREAHDLGWIDDPGLYHVDIGAALGVEAAIGIALLQ